MKRLFVQLAILIFAASSATAGTSAPDKLKDLYFGEALYHAYQGEWFDAVSRLDTEIAEHYGVDEPEKDTLHYHINQAKFDVGDFELFYRMHQRAGRAVKAVIDGNVEEPVRNEAIYRLARIYFQKDCRRTHRSRGPHQGRRPGEIHDDLAFCVRRSSWQRTIRRGGAYSKRHSECKSLEGFSTYNLGMLSSRTGRNLRGAGI
jgi:hypothetical protein